MSALIFPTSPTVGQRYPLNPGTGGVTQYVWSGTSWDVVPSSVSLGPTNQLAFNNYVWPLTDGASGQALVTNGSGTLAWSSSSSNIPWTSKGELIVGTGLGTSVLLNSGANTSFLVANSTAPSGLAYTDTLTSAVLLPAGNDTTNRPTSPIEGQVRYNTVDKNFEGYSGSPAAWRPFGDVPTGNGGDKIFYNNGQVITTDYTIPVGENSMTSGSISINTGVTVVVPAGSNWTIV
jgi:hypothetical protein